MIRTKSRDPKHFVTCGEMKLLERRADEDGLSYYQMMENAGTQAAKMIRAYCELAELKLEDAENVEAEDGLDNGEPGVDAAEQREPVDLEQRAAAAIAEYRVKIAEQAEDTIAYDVGNGSEAAGGIEEAVLENLPDKIETPLYAMIFCGSGNNGGDGFVVARRLAQAGYRVTAVLGGGRPKTVDAAVNFRLLSERPVDIISMMETEDGMLEQKEIPDLFVDAMFGTGFHGSMRGNALKATMYINSCREKHRTKVFALDIPSGLGGDQLCDTQLPGQIVHADCTIAFHAKKPIHLQKFAAAYCGRVLVADIGIDEEKLMTVEV